MKSIWGTADCFYSLARIKCNAESSMHFCVGFRIWHLTITFKPCNFYAQTVIKRWPVKIYAQSSPTPVWVLTFGVNVIVLMSIKVEIATNYVTFCTHRIIWTDDFFCESFRCFSFCCFKGNWSDCGLIVFSVEADGSQFWAFFQIVFMNRKQKASGKAPENDQIVFSTCFLSRKDTWTEMQTNVQFGECNLKPQVFEAGLMNTWMHRTKPSSGSLHLSSAYSL